MSAVWAALLVAIVGFVGLVDAVLLELGAGYFRTGYNGPFVASLADRSAFLGLAFLMDAAMVLGLWLIACPLLRRSRLGGLRQAVIAVVIGAGVPLALDVARYRIHRVLGDVVDFRLLWELSGASVSGSVAEMVSQAPAVALMGMAATLGVAVLVGLAGRIERRRDVELPPAPRGRVLLVMLVLAAVPAASGLALAESRAPRFTYGLERKPSGALMYELVERLTDFDRDGTGLISRPRDPRPFDPDVDPWAVDLPGNGVDENGFEGDLPPHHPRPGPPAVHVVDEGARPPVLLVFLESFRGDLLEARQGGRAVTPFLDRLAAEGSSTRHAYAHTPYTGPSREQLFSGSLAYRPGDPTLYDDFRARGYRIAHFSAQDDLHADAIERLRLRDADVFYDARDDIARKTSRTTASVSLQVSWKTLLERVEAFLEAQDPEVPLFLYVNVVDTHFPYDHAEMDDLLGTGHLDRSAIHPENAEQVRAAYRNAAANVDRAVEQLVGAWRRRFGDDTVILVTADHGQSFYEHGMLGHGQSLREEQTRVPLILSGVGGTWPEPIGLSDVRGLLLDQVFRRRDGRTRARFEPRPDRELFLYLARLDHPRLLGLRGLSRLDVLDLRRDRVKRFGADDALIPLAPAEEERLHRELILDWESLRLVEEGLASPQGAGR